MYSYGGEGFKERDEQQRQQKHQEKQQPPARENGALSEREFCRAGVSGGEEMEE